MDYDVFISYSHKDKNVADAIVNHLESDNIRCWYAPRDIQTGQEWASAIINAIGRTEVMILIFTDDSNQSIQVRREVDSAISHGMAIIPFKLTDHAPTGSMEYYLSTLHWLDAMNEPLETAIDGLKSRVKAILDGDAKEVTAAKSGNARYSTGTPVKPLKGTARVIMGVIAFPVLILGIGMFALGVFGLLLPEEVITHDALLMFLIAAFLLTPSISGVWMVKKKRWLDVKSLLMIAAATVVFFVSMSVFANL